MLITPNRNSSQCIDFKFETLFIALTRNSIPHYASHEPPGAEMNLPNCATSGSLSDAAIPHSQPFYPDYDLIAVTDVKYVKVREL